MEKAKIRLSAKEAELVVNTDWILTKNHILQKAKWLLEDLQSEQQRFLKQYSSILPPEVMAMPPKISKGENYKGLPYLVLDYPRYFGKEDHFAIRSMFWWGNFFSVTLHLSGCYKEIYKNKIQTSFTLLKEENFFIGVSDDQWEHHFETANYLSLKEMNNAEFENYISSKEFIKLAIQIPLEQWNSAGDILFTSFRQLIQWLSS